MKTKKLVFLSLLTAVSLGIWVIESQIPPPVPVPGVKLGLASVVTLAAMVLLGRKESLAVLGARIVLSCLVAGSFSAILFSLAGGLVSWAVMASVLRLFDEKRLWAVSVLGAIGHNAGQLAAALAVTKSPGILAYGPALLCAAIVTGAFTGVIAQKLQKALRGRIQF
ncbi:MAG: Gx transporter family protein [Oscillospiraceae bacterium]|nr:Gx transporter family protein [Oscillospiraceae bacterium]